MQQVVSSSSGLNIYSTGSIMFHLFEIVWEWFEITGAWNCHEALWLIHETLDSLDSLDSVDSLLLPQFVKRTKFCHDCRALRRGRSKGQVRNLQKRTFADLNISSKSSRFRTNSLWKYVLETTKQLSFLHLRRYKRPLLDVEFDCPDVLVRVTTIDCPTHVHLSLTNCGDYHLAQCSDFIPADRMLKASPPRGFKFNPLGWERPCGVFNT